MYQKTMNFRFYTTNRHQPPRLQQWWQNLERYNEGEWRDIPVVIDEDCDWANKPPGDGP